MLRIRRHRQRYSRTRRRNNAGYVRHSGHVVVVATITVVDRVTSRNRESLAPASVAVIVGFRETRNGITKLQTGYRRNSGGANDAVVGLGIGLCRES